MLAVGISEDGQREILGLEMALSETEEGWRRFLRQLKEARPLGCGAGDKRRS